MSGTRGLCPWTLGLIGSRSEQNSHFWLVKTRETKDVDPCSLQACQGTWDSFPCPSGTIESNSPLLCLQTIELIFPSGQGNKSYVPVLPVEQQTVQQLIGFDWKIAHVVLSDAERCNAFSHVAGTKRAQPHTRPTTRTGSRRKSTCYWGNRLESDETQCSLGPLLFLFFGVTIHVDIGIKRIFTSSSQSETLKILTNFMQNKSACLKPRDRIETQIHWFLLSVWTRFHRVGWGEKVEADIIKRKFSLLKNIFSRCSGRCVAVFLKTFAAEIVISFSSSTFNTLARKLSAISQQCSLLVRACVCYFLPQKWRSHCKRIRVDWPSLIKSTNF